MSGRPLSNVERVARMCRAFGLRCPFTPGQVAAAAAAMEERHVRATPTFRTPRYRPGCRALVAPAGLTREEFVAAHVAVCTAARCKKYDPKKNRASLHSLAYSRRRCAKALWRQYVKRGAVT